VAFAREWDPQRYHTDPQAAKLTPFGGLIASGWHTASLLMRMNCEEFLLRSASQGAPGVEEVRWVKPVRPGERLHVRRTTLSARTSKSRPDLGVVEFQFEVLNADGDVMMMQKNACFIGRRPREAA
jgi:acyl dehydratase